MPGIITGVASISSISNARVLNMVSLLIIVAKLCSYKDGHVRNLHKFKYLIQIFKTFVDARKHSLTSNLILFRPIMKVKSINKCEAILNYKQMILFIICQSMV